MKSLVLFVFFGFGIYSTQAQSIRIKRKYCKTYQGVIPAYRAQLGAEIVEIPSCKIDISLKKDSIFMQLGNLTIRNIYQIEKTDNPQELFILVSREDSDIPERIILRTKEKTILRKGIFPQPEVVLNKVKKSR